MTRALRSSCLLIASALHVCAEQSPAEEVDVFLRSNLVAAVVGYHTTREVSNGIRVPCFSPSVEVGNTNAYGVLLYVIAPTNYAGNFFWLRGGDPFNEDTTGSYYRPDRFYQFALYPDNPRTDIRDLLFKLSGKVEATFRDVFHVSNDELEKRLDRAKASKKDEQEKIPMLEKKLEDSQTQKERSANRYHLLSAKQRLIWAEEEEAELLRQRPLVREQWKRLRERVPPGFAWDDLSYIKEWERIKAEEGDGKRQEIDDKE